MDVLGRLFEALNRAACRYVLIGVSGANCYTAGTIAGFVTEDHDLFVPGDPSNLLELWNAADAAGFHLSSGHEPLGQPRDQLLAERVIERRAAVRAYREDAQVDFTLEMSGYDFDSVWRERRVFQIEGVEVPVARLLHIVESKRIAGRPKDQLFLASHEEALRELLRKP